VASFLLIIGCGLNCNSAGRSAVTIHANPNWRQDMQWTTPAFTDLRFGFEITMYIANR
jgi:coenzyme PQQ precursor peptide PqqA